MYHYRDRQLENTNDLRNRSKVKLVGHFLVGLRSGKLCAYLLKVSQNFTQRFCRDRKSIENDKTAAILFWTHGHFSKREILSENKTYRAKKNFKAPGPRLPYEKCYEKTLDKKKEKKSY